MVTIRVVVFVVTLVIAIVCGPMSSAAIVHRDIVDKVIAPLGGQIDIDGDGINDFIFFTGSVLESTGLVANGTLAENRILRKSGNIFAEPISVNTVVGTATQVFEQTVPMSVLFCSIGGGECLFSSPFINPDTAEVFMGVQFMKDGFVHNGMVGLTMFVGNGSILVQEYYYESESGVLLAIPAPGVFSMLLPVSAMALRRRRS